MTITDVKNTVIHDDESDWIGGLLRIIDTEYPEAFIKLQELFDVLGCETLMKRCKKKYTQNVNEFQSAHSKLWRLVFMVPKGITGL